MLVIVIQQLGMIENEISVDQIDEHECSVLTLTAQLQLVLNLDVIVVAFVDPCERIRRRTGIADLLADTPILADLLECGALDKRNDLADRIDPRRRRECDDAEAQRDACPDRMVESPEHGCSE